MRTDDRDYHVKRARQELDFGYRAACDVVADAHLRLAALHMASAESAAQNAGVKADAGPQRALYAPVNALDLSPGPLHRITR